MQQYLVVLVCIPKGGALPCMLVLGLRQSSPDALGTCLVWLKAQGDRDRLNVYDRMNPLFIRKVGRLY